MVNLHGKKYCFMIPEDQDPTQYGGYVPAVVIKGESGFYPLTGDPAQLQLPWVWGKTLAEAQAIADQYNAKRGLSALEVAAIITSSMRAPNGRQV